MDGTLARSRMPLEPRIVGLLRGLAKKHDVIVVSGSDAHLLTQRMSTALAGRFYVLGQNGNLALNKKSQILWENKLNWIEKHQIFSYAERIAREKLHDFSDLHDLVEDRVSQVGFSLIGHREEIVKKEAFDPSHEKRRTLLEKHPFRSDTVEVKIAGTTSLDFFIKGSHKGTNVARLIEHEGWKKKDAVYVGDCLFPGGNDEAVIGVIRTKKVESIADTERFIEKILEKFN